MQTSSSDKVAESLSFENFDILQKTKVASSGGAAMKTETSTADKRVVRVSRHDTDRQDANNINQDLHKARLGFNSCISVANTCRWRGRWGEFHSLGLKADSATHVCVRQLCIVCPSTK